MQNATRLIMAMVLAVVLTACSDPTASQRAKQETAQRALQAAKARQEAAKAALEVATAEGNAGIAGDISAALRNDLAQVESILAILKSDPTAGISNKGSRP